MRRSLALLPLLLIACSASTSEDAASSEANATDDSAAWAPYSPAVRADMFRREPLTPAGTVIADFGSEVRNQGHIAACASFSFLGLIENQMFNERGISPDLSERFMLYSNFLQTGTMGGQVEYIRRFAEMTEKLGVMNEELYPYAEIEKNAPRFEADAAQGLATDATQVLLSDAIEHTPAMSIMRSDIMQKPEYLGALPKGPYPVQLPIKATLQPDARVRQVEYQGKFYDCFASDPSAKPRLAVTPVEAMKMCFDVVPSEYFSCNFDEGAAIAKLESDPALTPTGDQCADAKTAADLLAKAQYESHRQQLQLTLGLLESGSAALLAVNAGGINPVWTSRTPQTGGHAVLAVGYLTYEDLTKVSEQSRGILGNGMFDKLLAVLDPSHLDKIAAAPTDAAKMEVRLNSALGARVKEEGGLVLFRNSWGKTHNGQPVGVEGHQVMTFEYFVRHGMMLLGRQEKRLDAFVSWAPDGACPTATSLGLAGAWAKAPTSAALEAQWRERLVPPTCAE